MAEEILDGINPTRMELLALKKREALAVKGHGLLKQKRDALIKEFFDILDRVEGARENAEKNLFNAYEALTEAQSVKESVKVDISSRSIMGVSVPITNMEMESRNLVERGYDLANTSVQLDEAAKLFEVALGHIIELGEIEKTIYLLADEIEATKRRVNSLEHIMIPRLQATVKSIDMRLQEMERENFVRMKMIRSTIEKNEAKAKEKAQILPNFCHRLFIKQLWCWTK